jgi:hypothetical protein
MSRLTLGARRRRKSPIGMENRLPGTDPIACESYEKKAGEGTRIRSPVDF